MPTTQKLIADFEKMIPKAAEAGVPNLICFSGNREGQNDNEGLINCANRHYGKLYLQLKNMV